jgi:hypothetical protein
MMLGDSARRARESIVVVLLRNKSTRIPLTHDLLGMY